LSDCPRPNLNEYSCICRNPVCGVFGVATRLQDGKGFAKIFYAHQKRQKKSIVFPSPGSEEFHKRSQFFVCTHNETLTVVAMCVANPNRLPAGINR
jgi:hypothetical protein